MKIRIIFNGKDLPKNSFIVSVEDSIEAYKGYFTPKRFNVVVKVSFIEYLKMNFRLMKYLMETRPTFNSNEIIETHCKWVDMLRKGGIFYNKKWMTDLSTASE